MVTKPTIIRRSAAERQQRMKIKSTAERQAAQRKKAGGGSDISNVKTGVAIAQQKQSKIVENIVKTRNRQATVINNSLSQMGYNPKLQQQAIQTAKIQANATQLINAAKAYGDKELTSWAQSLQSASIKAREQGVKRIVIGKPRFEAATSQLRSKINLTPTISPTPEIKIRGGPGLVKAARGEYQRQAFNSILEKAQKKGIESTKNIQLSGLSTKAYKLTQEFAKTTRRGAPILQEKINVVSPTTGKIIRYPIESVVRGAEMAGMLPGGIEVMAKRPGVIAPAFAIGLKQVAATPAAAKDNPAQFLSDVATLGLLFKGVPAAKAVVKIKPTVPKVTIPQLKPTAYMRDVTVFVDTFAANVPKQKLPLTKTTPSPNKVSFSKAKSEIKIINKQIESSGKSIANNEIKLQKLSKKDPEFKIVNDRIKSMRDAAESNIRKKWKIEDDALKRITIKIRELERNNQKVPDWMTDTQIELKVLVGKGGRSKARLNQEIKKVVEDALFKESLELRTIKKSKSTKTERQNFIKKLNKKIRTERNKTNPQWSKIDTWDRQIELAKTTRSSINEIITQTTGKKKISALKDLFKEEKAEARLAPPKLKAPTKTQINTAFRQVNATTVSKQLRKQYRNVPQFNTLKYKSNVKSSWNASIDKWNTRFVPEIISSKSATALQTKKLSASIMAAMLKHGATTAIGIVRLLPKSILTIYHAMTQMQKQTVIALIQEMLASQLKAIESITTTKPPVKPRSTKPNPRGQIKQAPPSKTKRKPITTKKAKEIRPPKEVIIPKSTEKKKKKIVKRRIITKEYTSFQIINQIAGIERLFG